MPLPPVAEPALHGADPDAIVRVGIRVRAINEYLSLVDQDPVRALAALRAAQPYAQPNFVERVIADGRPSGRLVHISEAKRHAWCECLYSLRGEFQRGRFVLTERGTALLIQHANAAAGFLLYLGALARARAAANAAPESARLSTVAMLAPIASVQQIGRALAPDIDPDKAAHRAYDAIGELERMGWRTGQRRSKRGRPRKNGKTESRP